MTTTLSFGAWLRQRRRALGLTHAALAEGVHCSVSALRKIEQDERRPSHPLAERLAAKLQIADGERARFLEVARGERHAGRLDGVAPLPLAPLPEATPGLQNAVAPFDPSTPSIAVLPFVTLGTEADDSGFADGLAEELLNVLSKIPGLRVASRTSAFSFKGQAVDLPTIARKLGVASVLEGSVRRAGQRVRITAQLIEVANDSHLWSQTYDRELSDIFAVQDDIAQSVVRGMREAVLDQGPEASSHGRLRELVLNAARGRTTHAKAQQLYLQARFLIERSTPDDLATAIGYCREALAIDPEYALAWAGLAGAYAYQAGWGWASLEPTFELARQAAQRALELEPDLPEAHAELGWIRMTHDWDWRGAEQSYRRALVRGSGKREIVLGASLLADNLGQNADAVALARRAVALDPLYYAAHGNLALRTFNAGALDESARAVETGLELNPRGALMHWLLATIRVEQGRLDEALKALALEEHDSLRLHGLVIAHHAAGERAKARAALDELIAVGAEDSAFQIAEVHACLGEIDAAFDWLERARQQRDAGVSQAQAGPFLRKLHGDPRWTQFLERMGFAVASRPAGA